MSILAYRNYIIGNPFYPLFSKIFSPADQQLIDWEQTLKGWDREGFFPLWIFVPKSFGKIGFVLGPANLLLFIRAILFFLKNLLFRKPLLTISVFQFILLLTFSQEERIIICPL